MNKSKSKAIDILLIILMILPFLACIVLKVLTAEAPTGEVSITGAQIYFTIPMPLMDLPVTEAQVVSVAVVLALLWLCIFLTRNLKVRPDSKRQLAAEWIVNKVSSMVHENMGDRFKAFAPLIAAIIGISAFSSLSCLLGLFAPTSDVNIVAGWAILTFVLITHYKLKGGLGNYVKGFFEPLFVFGPFNIIGEVATPVSMSFRHYGNVLSGAIISSLVATALGNVSKAILGWLPGVLGQFPLLRIGIPAILSCYFDVFSGALQAFIFAMLTMLLISTGFPEEEYERRKAKRQQKKALHNA